MEKCTTVDEIIGLRNKTDALREKIPYDIDGLVVKTPETDMEDMERARPEKQIAFKFELEEAVSTLAKVEWSESGVTYTPIGIVDPPVRLAGTTVRRANLCNPDLIHAMGLMIGSRVRVVKRGEIIPKIEGLAPDPNAPRDGEGDALFSENGNLTPIEFPTTCSSCGTPLVDEGSRLYCPSLTCPKRLKHRIEKWAAVLDIRELGDKLITLLFESGEVRDIADLYTLDEKRIAEFDRMGKLSAAKVVRNIRDVRVLSLAKFVAGFDIEGLGETLMDLLVDAGYNTLSKLRGAREEELAAVHGFGDERARTIAAGLAETREAMENVLALPYVRLKAPVDKSGLPLAGLSFCFTGELKTRKRKEAEAQVKELGGTAKSAVIGGLSYLVTNTPESGSAKNKKAAELNVKIIDETEFLRILETAQGHEE
jgi:DNA ligase (NAD+)